MFYSLSLGLEDRVEQGQEVSCSSQATRVSGKLSEDSRNVDQELVDCTRNIQKIEKSLEGEQNAAEKSEEAET